MKQQKFFRGVLLVCLMVGLLFNGASLRQVSAENMGAINFEAYSTGNINGQFGWSKTGAYDVEVAAQSTYASFGAKSLRLSNAFTSGAFGDQTFSNLLAQEAGETNAYSSAPTGNRQPYFSAQWDFASANPGGEQPGLAITASPDRGDGGRMSWIQMVDAPTGLAVNFYDYQDIAPYGSNDNPAEGVGAGDDFVLTQVAGSLSRSVPHTIKVEMYLVDGPHNDIVKVCVDGSQCVTGTSWEDYFRWNQGPGDGEQTAPVRESRTIRGLMFRGGGTAVPATAGKGFFVDNLSLYSGPMPPVLGRDLFCTGETGYVDVKLANVTDLYGYQFQVNYDKTKVSATAAFDNSFFSTVGAAIPGAWNATCADGACKFAASKMAPAIGVTGSGTVARITFVGLNPGVVTPVVAGNQLLSNVNGAPVAGTLSLSTPSVTVCGWASASGTVNLQGRTTPVSAGKVKLTGSDFGPYETAFSAATGAWSINNIRVMPTGTPYTFDATHGLYLGNQKMVTLTSGMADVTTTTLKGGDADNSGKVEVNDLTCIGGDFGGTPNVCGTTGSSDINEDGITNIFDLTIAGGNYDLVAPQGW